MWWPNDVRERKDGYPYDTGKRFESPKIVWDRKMTEEFTLAIKKAGSLKRISALLKYATEQTERALNREVREERGEWITNQYVYGKYAKRPKAR
jgi:hypothetical protein